MRLLYTMYGKILFGWIGRRRRNETISKSLDIMTIKEPDRGDTVGLSMTNRPEMTAIWIGLGRLGVVTFLINTSLRGDSSNKAYSQLLSARPFYEMWIRRKADLEKSDIYELDRFVENSESNLMRSNPIFLRSIIVRLYVRTTGIPKAVLCSHGRLTFLASAASVLNINENDVTYSAAPMYHLSGILGAAWAVIYGAPNVMVVKFSVTNFWQEIKRHNVTICLYVGEFLRFLSNQPVVNPEEEKRHTIRGMFGSGGMRPETWAKFQERFSVKEFVDLYGSTEGNCTLINLEGKPGTCDGEPGELIGKIVDSIPMSRFDGYTDPVATEKRIAHNVFKAGDKYFLSGDCLVGTSLDRIGDTFRWKAENVATTMVEAVISRLTGLRNNVVYGVKVPGTEGSCGMLSILDLLDGQLDLISLADGMLTSLPFYAIPMFIRLVNPRGNGLDMTGTFKFQKFRLRQDGFDIEKIQDPIFIYSTVTKIYRKLDLPTYKEVMNGNYRF
ncbi:Long-chain fatty acid transport protein 4 [Orchesella cincta]|uniref:Long-chain-fatty-acid--CoA ligase n=1 Tax=Orchesella cincta TaxID=48709 RepID=A0A1D2MBQ8_ORCCI|nr:Long-chain fatty acid transport protein 4 [Orchesella cincta]